MPAEHFVRPLLLLVLVLSAGAAPAAEEKPTQRTPPRQRERIGEVLGQPVYRDEIDASGSGENGEQVLEQELVRLFCDRLVERYLAKHKAEIEPTPAELQAATAAYRKVMAERRKSHLDELKEIEAGLVAEAVAAKPNAQRRQDLIEQRDFVKEMIEASNVEASLQAERGFLISLKFNRHLHARFGGRLHCGKSGLIAFDAERKLFLELEKSGDFRITDKGLRATFYGSWSQFADDEQVKTDQDEIRGLLYPAWLPREPMKTAATARPRAD